VIWYQFNFFKFGPVQIVAIVSIVFLTWINTRGIRTGKQVQNAFTFGKVLLLVLFIIIGLGFASNPGAIKVNSKIFWEPSQWIDGQLTPLSAFSLVVAICLASVGSLFSSDAWNNITFTAGEVINPRKNIPLSLFLGTLTVTILYLLANVVYITALPLQGDQAGSTVSDRGMQFVINDRLATAAITGVFGNYAVVIMAIFIMISTFGCNNGLILSGARVYYAMADDGIFFKKVRTLNKKDVPAMGLIIQCIWACLLCLSGTYLQLLDYVVFAVLMFYVLTIAGIFVLRKKRPDAERPYKAFGYPLLPAIYIILALTIMIILVIYKHDYSLPWSNLIKNLFRVPGPIPGWLIVLLGIPVYFIWKRRKPHA
jgi:APA family basic amino acid/polyamine antiporter